MLEEISQRERQASLDEFYLTYQLISQGKIIEGSLHTVYGISIEQRWNGVVRERRYTDISIHKETVELLLELMKKGTVTLTTSDDIVDDFVAIYV